MLRCLRWRLPDSNPMMDGFAEANLLLSTAMQELEELEASMRDNGNRSSSTSNLSARSSHSPLFHNHNNNHHHHTICIPKIMPDIDEGLDMDNGNLRDADDERSTKDDRWRSQDWANRRGSDGSSGVESPPSDIPTSSSSLCNPPKIYHDFVKAIEENAIQERPDLETCLKIMQWMAKAKDLSSQSVYDVALRIDLQCSLSVDSWSRLAKPSPLPPYYFPHTFIHGPTILPIRLKMPRVEFTTSYSDSIGSSSDLRRMSTLTVSSQNSHYETYGQDLVHSSGSGNVFREAARPVKIQPSRAALPYVTHYSDSGFGSAMSSGSSCSYLPPPPPYRMRPKQHKIHRSLSDSKYCSQQLEIPAVFPEFQRNWNSRTSLSPSPSMSTVSCPEYPEISDKLHRLSMARDSLSLQVSVLTEQVSAQKEKIRDLEALLAVKRKNLNSTEELLQEKYRADDCSELESKKMDLMAEMSSLKLKYATLEKEKKDTEKKLKHSQSEMDYVNQSMHGMVVQQQLQSQSNGYPAGFRPVRSESKQPDEMEQLRLALQRLMADNEAKNMQINSLRNALDEQIRGRQYQREDYYSPSHGWNNQQFDLNSQIKRLLMEDPDGQMPHSTSFPVSLCSSAIAPNARNTVQSSSSYTSSLSAASPQHWSDTPRHYNSAVKSDCPGYRPPSSPAARQLAAELDELRRVSDIHHSQPRNYSTASLPRGMGNKAASTLALPAKKLSLSSGISAGEFRSSASVASAGTRHKYRDQMNRWMGKLKRTKRATSAPNLVESDDEVTRGRNSTTASQCSSKNQKPLRRDRTRSSIRNLFSKLTRSTSQDHGSGTFKRGSTVRSTSMARLGSTGPLSGAIAIRPPFSQFVDWRSEQLCEWIAEIGFPQYVPDVAKHARSGRHLINMSSHEFESLLGIRNPLHRKRLRILLKNIEDDNFEPCAKWDVHMSLKWLEEIGLPQYKDVFTENVVDGAMLNNLTAYDMVEMHITNSHHYYTIARSLKFLRRNSFNIGCLEKRFDPNLTNHYPCSDQVEKWCHAATCEWLRTIDLAEFTPNLLCAGTPGALLVHEPTFTAESLADILKIPAHKTLIRRHLTHHFNRILGQHIIAEKRDFLASGVFPQLSPNNRIKVVKKGFSLTRKKAKNEICLEPEEQLCPKEVPVQNSDNTSSEFSAH